MCVPLWDTVRPGHKLVITVPPPNGARPLAAWWRHQMETFSALLAICAGNSPVPGEFPTLRPVTRSFDVFLDLRLNKRLSKQPWGWWFETLSCPLWRHRNGLKSWTCYPLSTAWRRSKWPTWSTRYIVVKTFPSMTSENVAQVVIVSIFIAIAVEICVGFMKF